MVAQQLEKKIGGKFFCIFEYLSTQNLTNQGPQLS